MTWDFLKKTVVIGPGRNPAFTQPTEPIQTENETTSEVDGCKQDRKEAQDDIEAFFKLPEELKADARRLWGNQWTDPNTDNAVTREGLVNVLNNQILGTVPTTVFTHALEEQLKGIFLSSNGATAIPEEPDAPTGESAGQEASGKPYPPTAPPEKWLENFRMHNNIESNVRKA